MDHAMLLGGHHSRSTMECWVIAAGKQQKWTTRLIFLTRRALDEKETQKHWLWTIVTRLCSEKENGKRQKENIQISAADSGMEYG
jgi:hypothetical protein